MVFNSAGNLGLGVTPSAWRSGDKVLDVGETISLYYQAGDLGGITNNQYINTSNTRVYKKNGYANMYLIGDSGTHKWFNAASGTAGNAISFTQAMTLDASGNLGVGVTSVPQTGASKEVSINGASSTSLNFLLGGTNTNYLFSDSTRLLVWANGASTNLDIGTGNANAIRMLTNSTERARIDSSGNFGLGVTPSAWGSVIRALQVNNTGMSLFTYTAAGTADQYAFLSNNSYQNSSYADTYVRTNPAAQYRQLNATHAWFNAPSGTAGNAISFTQAMTLDASGNLLLGTTSSVGSERLNVTQSSGNHNARIINSGSSGNIYGPLFNFSAQAPNNTVSLFLVCSDNSATRAQFYSNGGLANYSANNVNLSDRREKTNFAPATSYLDKICAIPVQTFNYLDQNLEEDDGLTLGVVAQDVQAIAPELVTETNWGTVEEPKMRLSIYQTDLQYALMKALQELKTEFDAYKASHP